MIIRCYTGLNGGNSMLIQAETMAENTLISAMAGLGSRGRGMPGAGIPLSYREINNITEQLYPVIADHVPQAPATFESFMERVVENNAQQNIEDMTDDLTSSAMKPNNLS